MKSKFKLFTMFLLIFLPFFVHGYTQKGTLTLRDDIILILEQQAKNTFGNDYVVSNFVIMDSVIGKGPIDVELEDILDPFNTLAGIIIFSTYTEENPEEQYFCFYKNNSIIWYYEDKIGYWWSGQIFTTNDINNDGKVEIVTIWSSMSEYVRGEDGELITFDYICIFNWDGVNGNLLNDPTFKSGGMFEMIDLELDGVYEFRAYWEPIWGEYSSDYTPAELPWVIFGWNGSEYTYIQEIQTPGYQYIPTDGVVLEVSCKVSITGEEFGYNYKISSDNQSKQRINAIYLKDALNVSNYKSPQNWKAQVSGSTNGISWYVFDNNKPSMIYPGNNLSGFGYDAVGLPSINYYYIQGYQPEPHLHGDYAPPFSIEEFRNNKINNSVSGMTIVPKDPPDPFIPINFLDTLLNYNQHSLQFGWITNQQTADKYDTLFSTAKTLLEGNHIPWVDSTLHTVLEEVDEDSSGNITSEAYALLRYNTEYLLENLPEVIPPVLNSISPAIVLRYISGGVPPSGLTVTVTGANFSDSSVAYFNGSTKTTTVVSDTVLTFPITGSEMSTLGNYFVWISTYGSNSDTLTFYVVDNLPQTLAPTLQCVHYNGGSSYTAYFGYNNDNSVSVYVPLGSKNKFSPSPIDRGQPNLFLPGSHISAFSLNFDGSNITWTLDQTSITANKKSEPCP